MRVGLGPASAKVWAEYAIPANHGWVLHSAGLGFEPQYHFSKAGQTWIHDLPSLNLSFPHETKIHKNPTSVRSNIM